MTIKTICPWTVAALAVLAAMACGTAFAQQQQQQKKAEQIKQQTIEFADGRMAVQLPAEWQRKEPRVNIIEHEFELPGKDGQAPGRLTVMGAAGSVEQNIERWSGQFGGVEPKVDKKTLADQEVYVVELSGTFNDQRGPLAPAQTYENYRMLGAVIVSDDAGKYFFKLTGPAETIEAQADAFQQMVESLKVK